MTVWKLLIKMIRAVHYLLYYYYCCCCCCFSSSSSSSLLLFLFVLHLSTPTYNHTYIHTFVLICYIHSNKYNKFPEENIGRHFRFSFVERSKRVTLNELKETEERDRTAYLSYSSLEVYRLSQIRMSNKKNKQKEAKENLNKLLLFLFQICPSMADVNSLRQRLTSLVEQITQDVQIIETSTIV